MDTSYGWPVPGGGGERLIIGFALGATTAAASLVDLHGIFARLNRERGNEHST